jgi:cyclopropane-fatty-acyl-phospholipid synthase
MYSSDKKNGVAVTMADTGEASVERGGITQTDLPSRVRGWAKAVSFGRNMDATAAPSTTQRWARALVHNHLKKMQRGSLILNEPGGESFTFGAPAAPDNPSADTHDGRFVPVHAVINLEDPAAYTAIAFNGVVGAAEGFMDGYWSTPDLLAVVRFFVSNIGALKQMDQQRSIGNRIALSVLSRVTRNSLSGSRKNISAHYDLGNDFFELFLDPSMMYSAAWFNQGDITLAEASTAKLQLICEKLELKPSDHLVEIGTGWGGMAVHAATHFGCRVTTTTISRQQYDYTKKLVGERGLDDRVTVLMRDYRELDGRFDKLVSIEMIEAVGHKYFSEYFHKCSSLLKPHGLMLLQAITIADQRYQQARKSVDFIQRYIFPGGCLPSMSVISQHVTNHTDMVLFNVQDMSPDYARTLNCWRRSFENRVESVKSLGFDDRFVRMWLYYLCYCEGGFMERVINSVQVVLAKPDYRN